MVVCLGHTLVFTSVNLYVPDSSSLCTCYCLYLFAWFLSNK